MINGKKQYKNSLTTGDTNVCNQFDERGYSDFKGFARCLLNSSESFTPKDCINGIANSTQDIRTCEGWVFGTVENHEDDCLSQIKLLPKNPPMCKLLNSNEVEDCYAFVARANFDANQCNIINDLVTKSFCVREISLSNKNISICDQQSNPHIKYHCYSGLAEIGFYEKEHPSDITQESRNKITVDLCKKIDEDDSLQDFCFMSVIIYHNDSTLCNRKDIPQKRRVSEGCNYIGAFS